MYYGPLPHSPSHMNPQEVVSYPLQGFGSTPPSQATDSTSVVGTVQGLVAMSSPLLIAYGLYKRGHGIGVSTLGMIGSGIALIPALIILAFVPFGWAVIPAASAYYAFKD